MTDAERARLRAEAYGDAAEDALDRGDLAGAAVALGLLGKVVEQAGLLSGALAARLRAMHSDLACYRVQVETPPHRRGRA